MSDDVPDTDVRNIDHRLKRLTETYVQTVAELQARIRVLEQFMGTTIDHLARLDKDIVAQ